jgi:hypothetical protein
MMLAHVCSLTFGKIITRLSETAKGPNGQPRMVTTARFTIGYVLLVLILAAGPRPADPS